MGCPPTKVNTQTTHSCPSPKQANTLTNTHTDTPVSILPIPYLSSGIFPCQSFRFFGSGSPIPFFKWEITFFLFLIFLFTSLHFPLQAYSAHTFLLPTYRHTLTHKIQRTRLSLNLNPFGDALFVHPVSNSPSFKSTRQSQPELDVGHLCRTGCF